MTLYSPTQHSNSIHERARLALIAAVHPLHYSPLGIDDIEHVPVALLVQTSVGDGVEVEEGVALGRDRRAARNVRERRAAAAGEHAVVNGDVLRGEGHAAGSVFGWLLHDDLLDDGASLIPRHGGRYVGNLLRGAGGECEQGKGGYYGTHALTLPARAAASHGTG